MIQNNPMRNLCNYASSAVYKDPPNEDQIRNGVIPLDSLPAAWWNWLWNQTNGAVIEAKTAMNSVINELNSVLSAACITPQSACMDQLYNAIDCLRQTLATTAVAGAVKSSTSCGKVSVDANGIMTANGLGNVGNLTTVTKTTVVEAINEFKDDYETCVGVLGNAINGLDNSKAPNNHASTTTTYGVGNTTSYGHVKLSDTYSSAVGGVSEGVAASQKAVNDMYNAITSAGYVTLGNTAGYAIGTASAGSATTAARSDHTHPFPTSLVNGTESVVAEGGNELNIYVAGASWINYRGGSGVLHIGNGAAGLGIVCAAGFCGTASSALSATSAGYATDAGNTSGHAGHLLINGVTWDSSWWWNGQSGQPTWLWGSNDGVNMYIWNPSNFSVNYASSANRAGSAGRADGAYCVFAQSHPDSWYLRQDWDGVYFQTQQAEAGGGRLPIKVAAAGSADSAGTASYAVTAGSANSAANATNADYAVSANHSTYSSNADYADCAGAATHSCISDYVHNALACLCYCGQPYYNCYCYYNPTEYPMIVIFQCMASPVIARPYSYADGYGEGIAAIAMRCGPIRP